MFLEARISGGLFNPAVTLGLALAGKLSPIRAGYIFLAQIIGGIAAAGIVDALLPGKATYTTTLSEGTSVVRGLFIEMLCTTMLVLAVFLLATEVSKARLRWRLGAGGWFGMGWGC